MEFLFCPRCAAPLAPIADGEDAGLPACPTGHFVHYANPAVTTFAFIEHDGLYLALRRAKAPCEGEWDMPGGFIEAGEYPEDSIRREIREETGLEVGELQAIGAWTGQYGADGKWTVDIAYRCPLTGGDFMLSDEKSEHGWFDLADYPEPAFNSERIALRVLREGVAAR